MARDAGDMNRIIFRDGSYFHDIGDSAVMIVSGTDIRFNKPLLSASVSVVVVSGSPGNLTVGENQHFVGADATSANCGVTLPSATTVKGRMYTIKKLDVSANLVHISGAGTDKIWSSGSNPTAFINLRSQGQSYSVISDGAIWHVCGFYSGTAAL